MFVRVGGWPDLKRYMTLKKLLSLALDHHRPWSVEMHMAELALRLHPARDPREGRQALHPREWRGPTSTFSVRGLFNSLNELQGVGLLGPVLGLREHESRKECRRWDKTEGRMGWPFPRDGIGRTNEKAKKSFNKPSSLAGDTRPIVSMVHLVWTSVNPFPL